MFTFLVYCCCSIAKLHLTLLWSHGLQPVRLLCPWDFPGKNTGGGCHFFLQGIFPTQGLNPGLLLCRQILYHWATWEAQWRTVKCKSSLLAIWNQVGYMNVPLFNMQIYTLISSIITKYLIQTLHLHLLSPKSRASDFTYPENKPNFCDTYRLQILSHHRLLGNRSSGFLYTSFAWSWIVVHSTLLGQWSDPKIFNPFPLFWKINWNVQWYLISFLSFIQVYTFLKMN